jgi:hypothetical protein
MVVDKRAQHHKRQRRDIPPITEPFYSLLMPFRIPTHTIDTQSKANFYWPPNGPAVYFCVPSDKWSHIEQALLESDDPRQSTPFLSYWYRGRPHALQLDIDGSPLPLGDVAKACQNAMRASRLDVSYVLEQSPPKDAPGFDYGRLTFPHVVVDEEGSRRCKLVCAQACHRIFSAACTDAPLLTTWVTQIIDPASRTARTHHSGKLPDDPKGDCRVSRVVAYVRGDGSPHPPPYPTAWLCPLRVSDTPLLDYATLAGPFQSAVRTCERSLSRVSQMVHSDDTQTVTLQGRTIKCVNMNELATPDVCIAVETALQTTEYSHTASTDKPLRLTFLAYMDQKKCFIGRTTCKYCPWRESCDHRVLDALGKRNGALHNDNHIWFVFNDRKVRLRCSAQWHHRSKAETKRSYKEQDQTPVGWTQTFQSLFPKTQIEHMHDALQRTPYRKHYASDDE